MPKMGLFLFCLLAIITSSFGQSYPVRNILIENQPIMIVTKIAYLNSTLYQHNYTLVYSQQQQAIVTPKELLIPQVLEQNITIQVELYCRNFSTHEYFLLDQKVKNLTRYQKVIKIEDSFFVSYDPIDQIQSVKQSNQKENSNIEYDLHIPNQFDIMFIVNLMEFPSLRSIKPEHKLKLMNYQGITHFLPQIDLGQLYIPVKRSAQLPRGKIHNLKINIFPQNYLKFLSFYSFGHPEQFTKALGSLAGMIEMKQEHMDEIKQMFFQNPLWLVILYFTLSFAEIFFKMAFIKSQFAFWKNIDKNKGVSLKILFFQLFADIVMGLYLYEYQANKMLIIFHIVDIIITTWKITRTYSLKIVKTFPFINFETSQLYKQRQKIDNQSIWYMNYILVPLMGIYLVYSLNKRNWIINSYYKFLLQYTVAFIALFGFILMTPQLYLNFKLKSVDHLNWRGLIYRFMTTFIDDLFALMITMPPLRRIMYFRDDVIFIIYLYQRKIYKTDFSRKTISTYDQPNKKEE